MWTPQTCTCHVLPMFLLCKGNSPKNLLLLAYIHALSSMRLCLVSILWSLPLSLRIQSWELLWPMALPGSGAAVPALAGSDMLWLSRSCVTKSRNGCHSCSVCQLWKSSAFVLLKQCTCLVLGLNWANSVGQHAVLWQSSSCSSVLERSCKTNTCLFKNWYLKTRAALPGAQCPPVNSLGERDPGVEQGLLPSSQTARMPLWWEPGYNTLSPDLIAPPPWRVVRGMLTCLPPL